MPLLGNVMDLSPNVGWKRVREHFAAAVVLFPEHGQREILHYAM